MLIQDKIKISAVLNIHNEEKQLEHCLKSLNFVDEIIIIVVTAIIQYITYCRSSLALVN